MHCVLAVDGGNTKTLAVIAALDGTILGAGQGGCGDIYNARSEDAQADSATVALANTERTILAALREAGLAPTDLTVGVFNMAGADWPEDIAFWRDAMTARGYGRIVLAQNDALGVLFLGSPDATGVSVVCGTGVATGARAPNGRIWHSSFWQDEAQGASHLGQKTLFAIYRSALGTEPSTTLTERVLAHFGVRSVEEVLHLFHDRRHPAPTHIDRLTPILLDEAHAGDAVALGVVREHGAALGNIALAAARQVGLEDTAFPLVLAGGMFRHPTTVLEDTIVTRIRAMAPGVRPLRSPAEPIVGVLLQALTLAGAPPDAAVRARLTRALEATTFSAAARSA